LKDAKNRERLVHQDIFLMFFAGDNCGDANIGYIAAFGSIFSTLGLISIFQLVRYYICQMY